MSPVTRSAPSLARMPTRATLGAFATSVIAVLAGAALPAQAVEFEPAPGEAVVAHFAASTEQYEWVVPEGVREITVQLAAGSGGSVAGDGAETPSGGAGGHIVATLPVAAGTTLVVRVGGAGAANAGGAASALAVGSDLLAVVGGGGAGWSCSAEGPTCASGGAGGYSATASGPAGVDALENRAVGNLPVAGTAGSTSVPGVSGYTYVAYLISGVVDNEVISREPAVPGSGSARVVDGQIELAPGALGENLPGGGSGYFAGGHGGSLEALELAEDPIRTDYYLGGAGGGSGFLADTATLVSLHDNVGDGFASISYVVPEPEVVEDAEPEATTVDPEPQLVDTNTPTLVVSASSVRAGASLELSGTGLDVDRAYPVILNSDPVLLGQVTADAQGAFATTVTIPTSVHPGEHVITVGAASIPITVLAADVVPQPRMAPPAPELAATGTTDDLAGAGLAALALLGVGALVLRRARQTQNVE